MTHNFNTEILDSTLKGTQNPTFFGNNRSRNPRPIVNPKLGTTLDSRNKTYASHLEKDIISDRPRLEKFRLDPKPDLESMYSLLEFLFMELKAMIFWEPLVHSKPIYDSEYLVIDEREIINPFPKAALPKIVRYLEIFNKIKSYNGIYNDATSREIISIVFSNLPTARIADTGIQVDVKYPKYAFSREDRKNLPKYPDINRVYINR